MVSPLCLSVQLLYHFKNYLYYFDQFGVTCNVNCFFDLGYFFCLDLSRVAPPLNNSKRYSIQVNCVGGNQGGPEVLKMTRGW